MPLNRQDWRGWWNWWWTSEIPGDVYVAAARCWVADRFDWMAASIGRIAFLSSMRSV
jgi:hypothetical protein